MKRILFLAVLLCFLGVCGIVKGQVPVITGDNKDTSVCQGADVSFTINASNSPTQYEWQLSGLRTIRFRDIGSDNPVFSGLNTNTLTVHTANFAWGASYMVRCIASNAEGSSAPSPTFIIRMAQPHPGFTISAPNHAFDEYYLGTVCQGSTGNYFQSGMNYDIDSVLWSYSGAGASIHRDFANLHSVTDSSIVIDFSANATSGILTAIDSNACGIYTSLPTPVTINPPASTVGGAIGYGPFCTTTPYYLIGDSYTAYSPCAPISTLTTSASNLIYGQIKSCVVMDATVQSFNGMPYVQRHYSIEPQSFDGSSTTATVTLYFTQADFDAYNLVRGTNPSLPTGSADAAGIANLRVTQFHGTGTDPGTFVGGSGDIDPDDNNIVWDATASRWEVTFNITGFSGFFVSSGSLVPLPLTLVSFTGQTVTGGNLMSWVTASEQNTRDFEVQRDGGNGFQPLAVVPAAGNSHQNLNYSYTDVTAANTSASNSYRLKMSDLDGKFTYSKVVVLESPLSALSIRILPNPFHQPLSLTVNSPQIAGGTITVTDISGKLLIKQNVSLQKGKNNLDAGKIANLPKGMYLISVVTEGQQQTVKFVRE